ncbi:hypothetical protein CA601_34780 [Paraburkholderia hospita]|nr:hypothetical protein CA601_34780 [Paraburkholderia hospita]
MKLGHELDNVRHRLGRKLHLAELREAIQSMRSAEPGVNPEWVIVYRTASGFCCMYHGIPVEFIEMLDVQIWSEEIDVQPYFIGL